MIKFFSRLILGILLLTILNVIWGKFYNPIITITQINGYLEFGKLDRDYISYEEMGSNVKKAVLASEDQNFYKHNGFDIDAIGKAIIKNRAGGKIKGGSTISMQTAKNVFLWQNRDYVRKGLEAVFTFIIEKTWGKKTILERYLNCIEMGQGVFGVEAASKYYFKKSTKDLSPSEAAWIAAILPNPQKYDPKNPSSYLQKKHRWILAQMRTVQLQ